MSLESNFWKIGEHEVWKGKYGRGRNGYKVYINGRVPYIVYSREMTEIERGPEKAVELAKLRAVQDTLQHGRPQPYGSPMGFGWAVKEKEKKMGIESRIEQAPACQVINLTEPEKDLYTGAGWKLARFENGVLASFFDPMEVAYQADVQAMADEALEAATTWLANATGEVWLVMCSCYQLCEPRRITMGDAAALARMARVFGEQFAESGDD